MGAQEGAIHTGGHNLGDAEPLLGGGGRGQKSKRHKKGKRRRKRKKMDLRKTRFLKSILFLACIKEHLKFVAYIENYKPTKNDSYYFYQT